MIESWVAAATAAEGEDGRLGSGKASGQENRRRAAHQTIPSRST